MAKNNYYVVKKGRKTGIFETWKECQAQINGYSGAIFKGFQNLYEAQNYLKFNLLSDIQEEDLIDYPIAYVDGSFSEESKMYSFGCVVLCPKQDKPIEIFGINDDERYLSCKNVAGELEGVKKIINWAIKNNHKKLLIRYDYTGIENWATGTWEAKTPLTIDYVKFIQEKSKDIILYFEKIIAHSGNKHNDHADSLAKRALTII